MKKCETEEEKNKQRELIYEYNIIRVKYIILRERMNQRIQLKILDKIFNEATFCDILISYLFNRQYIELYGQKIPIKGFKTFEKFLTDENKNLKKRIKNKLLTIIKRVKKK